MNVLLFGGDGFVGRALHRALLARGHAARVVSRPHSLVTSAANAEPAISSDDTKTLQAALADCTHLFHLASATTPGVSRREPSREIRDNLLPTAQLLEALGPHPAIQTIFLSSGGAIYGNCGSEPVGIEALPAPISNYGAGKAAIEAFMHAHHASTGSAVTVLRPSNLYGPGQTTRGSFGVVPALLQCARDGVPFDLWGDGDTTRDFLYIDDFIALCLKLVERTAAPTHYELFNVGSGIGCSINALIAQVEAVTGRTIVTRQLDARGVDVKHVVLNSDKIGRALQWQPQVDLGQGLALTWQWFVLQARRGKS
jgi:UDP-glucose 4-epimerase